MTFSSQFHTSIQDYYYKYKKKYYYFHINGDFGVLWYKCSLRGFSVLPRNSELSQTQKIIWYFGIRMFIFSDIEYRQEILFTGNFNSIIRLSVSACTNSYRLKLHRCRMNVQRRTTMAAAGHDVAFTACLWLVLSTWWAYTIISNVLTCMWMSVWIVSGPRLGFKWNFNDRIMTEGETSVTHIHRSITLSDLHHTAIILFTSEGSHGPLLRPTQTTNEVFMGLLGEYKAATFHKDYRFITMCWQWNE